MPTVLRDGSLRFNVTEAKRIGLYHADDFEKALESGKGLAPCDRGSGVTEPSQAKLRLHMVEDLLALDDDDRNSPALGLLKSMFRRLDKKSRATEVDFTVAYSTWKHHHALGKKARLAKVMAELNRKPIKPLIEQWNGWSPKSKGENDETVQRYMSQVWRWFHSPHGVKTVGEMTVEKMADYLTWLKQQPSGRRNETIGTNTLEKHSTGLSAFIKWGMSSLGGRVFGENFVLRALEQETHLKQYSDDELRDKALLVKNTEPELKAFLANVEGHEAKALFALLIGTCLEQSAVYNPKTHASRLFRKNFRKVDGEWTREIKVLPVARQTKAERRKNKTTGKTTKRDDRWVYLLDEWCWAIVKPYLDAMPNDDTPFTTRSHKHFRLQFDKAMAAAGLERLPDHALHTFRHSFATRWTTDVVVPFLGRPLTVKEMKQQLGHGDESDMLGRVYQRAERWEPETASPVPPTPPVFKQAKPQAKKSEKSKVLPFRRSA